jgi:hypothetical protein
MNMTETQSSSDIYGLLLDRSSARVLMLGDETDGWALPHVHIPDKRLWPAMVGTASSAMQYLLGTYVTVLRRVDAIYSADRSHVDLFYELENQTADWKIPPQSQWIDRATLETLPLTHAEQRGVIEAELIAVENDQIPGLRPAWAQPGWFQAASAWIHTQLRARNYRITGSIQQVKSWGISCLLRASTEQGDIYFKVASSLPLFGDEPRLLQAISARFPDCVPAPVAIEPSERWMLMPDFGAELRDMPSLDKWETAVLRFGRLQTQAVAMVEDLLAAGCLDRRLDVLARQIDPLMDDEITAASLSTDEMAQLQALAPRLKAMCGELAGYRVPYSLNHGDLHGGNITGESLLFFDWTDACIAHPFLDLSTVVDDVEAGFPDGRGRIVDAYLNLWTAYEPIDRLRGIWQVAEPLGALHQAVSYQHILAALEPNSRPELSGGLRYWLQQIVKTMPSEPS